MSEKKEIAPGQWLDKAEWEFLQDFRKQCSKILNDVNESIDKAIERTASVYSYENCGPGLYEQMNHPNNINLYNTFSIDEFNKYLIDLANEEA